MAGRSVVAVMGRQLSSGDGAFRHGAVGCGVRSAGSGAGAGARSSSVGAGRSSPGRVALSSDAEPAESGVGRALKRRGGRAKAFAGGHRVLAGRLRGSRMFLDLGFGFAFWVWIFMLQGFCFSFGWVFAWWWWLSGGIFRFGQRGGRRPTRVVVAFPVFSCPAAS